MEIKELGHVVLYVRDLERSRRFYRDVLGWAEIDGVQGPVAAFTTGRTHHELLLIEVGADAAAIPQGRRVGMYHFGVKIGTSDEQLRSALAELQENGIEIAGTADHTVSHSIYLCDPDGNDVELYIDVQPEIWRDDPRAVLQPPRRLAL